MVSPADPPPLRQTGLVALDFGAIFRASAQAPQPATAQIAAGSATAAASTIGPQKSQTSTFRSQLARRLVVS